MNIERLGKINYVLKIACFALWLTTLVVSVVCLALIYKDVEPEPVLVLIQRLSFSVAILSSLIRLHIVDSIVDWHREAAGVLATYIVDKYVEEEEDE